MWFSAQHQVVVYTVPEPAQIVAAIDGARQVNGTMVAVPATAVALQLARVLGLPVPPLLDLVGYDWPMPPGRSPYDHQRHMANFHVLHPRAFNLSEMGTGKTSPVLWAADYLMQQGLVHSALILAPLSTLKRVWDDEIFRMFVAKRKARILHSAVAQDRLDNLRRPADFYIINHDGLGIGTRRTHLKLELGPLASYIRDNPRIDLVIVDEASAYKDHATLRSRILRATIGSKPFIWCLSGTPTPNAPTDAYGLARLTGNLAGESFKSFQGRTMLRVSQFKWVPRANSAETARAALTPAIRYSRAECIDLPECVVETRDVELSPTQERAYKELKKDLQVTLSNGRIITAVNEAVLRLKLVQIACGAVYGPDREVHKTDCGPRLKILKEVIDEAGAKVLIFAPLTSVVQLLFAELKAEYGEHAVARVYGGTSQKERSEIFRRFEQEAEPRMIVADPSTMSHGLTLVAADTSVWFGPTDKGEIYDQACARINRPGQKRKMLIVRLASTPVEREIYKRLAEKQSLQGAVLKLAEEER